ncbi:MAG: polyprenyl synthetase family protein [Eubacterium sp.]|nr:polyprenyl synthetase family protein [Eubacterium sp.]
MLERKIEEIEDIITGMLPEESGYAKTILGAANYSITAGGKRLRPLLMREFFRLYDGGDETVLKHFMMAIEMIHTYSLVHDDLPALDNDELRRGKQTTHKVYGEALGILAGDALLNMAYEQVAYAMKSIYACETISGVSRKEQMQRTVKAFDYLSARSGVDGMVGGQVVDVENNGDFVDDEMLLYVYRNKTGALIAAAMMVGAVLGGADEFDIMTIERMGAEIGVAFQIRDDILDVIGDEDKLGKPIHSDEELGKSTYVAHHGIEESENAVKAYTEHALKLFDSLKIPSGSETTKKFVRDIFMRLVERES